MRFGSLADGEKFYYNGLKWEKDTNMKERVLDKSKSHGLLKNAKGEDYTNAYFADHIEIKPIIKEEEK